MELKLKRHLNETSIFNKLSESIVQIQYIVSMLQSSNNINSQNSYYSYTPLNIKDDIDKYMVSRYLNFNENDVILKESLLFMLYKIFNIKEILSKLDLPTINLIINSPEVINTNENQFIDNSFYELIDMSDMEIGKVYKLQSINGYSSKYCMLFDSDILILDDDNIIKFLSKTDTNKLLLHSNINYTNITIDNTIHLFNILNNKPESESIDTILFNYINNNFKEFVQSIYRFIPIDVKHDHIRKITEVLNEFTSLTLGIHFKVTDVDYFPRIKDLYIGLNSIQNATTFKDTLIKLHRFDLNPKVSVQLDNEHKYAMYLEPVTQSYSYCGNTSKFIIVDLEVARSKGIYEGTTIFYLNSGIPEIIRNTLKFNGNDTIDAYENLYKSILSVMPHVKLSEFKNKNFSFKNIRNNNEYTLDKMTDGLLNTLKILEGLSNVVQFKYI